MIDYKTELNKQKEELEKKEKQYIRLFDKLSYQQNNKMVKEIVTLKSNIKTLEQKMLRLRRGDNND